MKKTTLLPLISWLPLVAASSIEEQAKQPACRPSPQAATRGALLLQTGQRTGVAPRANASALLELLPRDLSRELPEGRSSALPVEWWDPALTKAPIYVQPMWGLSNRLRTIAGAFVAGRAVGRNVAVIWKTSPQCPQEIGELFRGVTTAAAAPASARTLTHGHLCEYRAETPAALEQVPADQPLFASACDFSVKSLLEQRHVAFHAMHLQPVLRAEVAALLGQLRGGGRRAIGVHIRQGSLQDARQGSFFGRFSRPPASMTEIPCCTDESPSWVCPRYAHPLSKYIQAMREKAGGSPPVFFVASDRPACIGSLKQQPSYVNVLHNRLPGTDSSGRNNVTAALIDMYALAACQEMLHQDPGSWTGLVHSIHQGFAALAEQGPKTSPERL